MVDKLTTREIRSEIGCTVKISWLENPKRSDLEVLRCMLDSIYRRAELEVEKLEGVVNGWVY